MMISLQGARKTYQRGNDPPVRALDNVSLEVERGELLAIVGSSGSGKSTLLNVLGLLDRPNRGRYELDGRDVTALSDDELARVRREKIGFVFQFFHLVPRLTAEQNIELPMVLAGIAPAERRERVERLLAEYGLEARAHHRPDQLSGGQCQRVAIARSMSMQPSVILADEPTGNLDPANAATVFQHLERFRARGGTVVVVTHGSDAAPFATRLLHLVAGRLRSDIATPVQA